MPDMLVKLYTLDDPRERINALGQEGIVIRRALPPERHHVVAWVRERLAE